MKGITDPDPPPDSAPDPDPSINKQKIIKKQCSGTESCSFLQNLQDAKKNCLPNSGGTFISVFKYNKLLRTVEIKIFLYIFPC